MPVPAAPRPASRADALDDRLRDLLDRAPEFAFTRAADGRIVWANAALERAAGRSLRGADANTLRPSWVEARVEREALPVALREGAWEGETALLLGDGRELPVRKLLVPHLDTDGELAGYSALLRDISRERDDATRFRSVLDTLQEGIVLQDRDGTIRTWNPAAERILGLTGSQLAGRTSYDARWRAIDADGRDLPGDRHPSMRALASGEPVTGELMGVHRPDGSMAWLRVSATPIALPDAPSGRGVVATFVDITSERLAELAVQSSEERLRLVTDNSRDVICLHAPDGRYEWISAAAEVVLGWTPADLVGRDPYEFFHPDDRERIRVESHEPLLRGTPRWSIAYRYRSRDGGYRWVETTASVVADGDGGTAKLVTTTRRIDERRADEERDRSLARLDAVGEFAGLVSHEFTNLLSVVSLALEMNRARDDGALGDELEEARAALKRAVSLSRDLRAVSRHEPMRAVVTTLQAVLEDARPALHAAVPSSLPLSVQAPPPALAITADRDALRQSLVTLVERASAVSRPGGRVAITVRDERLAAPLPHAYGAVPPGRWAVASVRDEGASLEATELARALEPRLASERVDRSQLALAVVGGRQRQVGGHVIVHAVPGGGTVVELWFPVVEARTTPRDAGGDAGGASERPSAGAAPIVDDAAGEPAARPLVLVVDDDELVLRTTVRVLERSGFRARGATTGRELLALLDDETVRREARALVSDVVMPELSGPRLVARVRERMPTLPVIYISGYTGDALPELQEVAGEARLVSKPFAPSELVSALQEAMADGRSDASAAG